MIIPNGGDSSVGSVLTTEYYMFAEGFMYKLS